MIVLYSNIYKAFIKHHKQDETFRGTLVLKATRKSKQEEGYQV